ncbi:MAG: homocysteine S-methyltransferase family protein, partial [Gammaproteobacteria bacterium]
ENYIGAGVDVITVNSYASARHNLEPIGLGEKTGELNLRAVMLAQDARDRCAKERPIYIAGSVSNYGLLAGAEPGWAELPYFQGRTETSDAQAQANLREHAEILAQAGVDLLLAEPTGSTTQRRWVVEACLATGLPVWTGFKCRLDEGDTTVKVGYRSAEPLVEAFEGVAALGGTVVTLFHSPIEATNAALGLVKRNWRGPLAVYPEADRQDYVNTYRDRSSPTRITPEQFVTQAQQWVNQGVQIIGGCCGIEIEYIRPLRDALPAHIPEASDGT